MGQIIVDSVNGIPPYKIFVCDYNQYNCDFIDIVTNSIPPIFYFEVPSKYDYSPIFIVKIVDSQNCEFVKIYSCSSPTNTPTITSTVTITPTITPTNSLTPTVSPTEVTPTVTPTFTPTMTKTPNATNTPNSTQTSTVTKTKTPSITPTITPTISLSVTVSKSIPKTPTPTRTPNYTPPSWSPPPPQVTPTESFPFDVNIVKNYSHFLIFIEPTSGASLLSSYMVTSGTSFLGFSNGTALSKNQINFQNEFSLYASYDGFQKNLNGFRVIQNYDFQNKVFSPNFNQDRNFTETIVSANTINGNSWITILISTAITQNYKQSIIGVSIGQNYSYTPIEMNSDYYNLTVNLKSFSYLSNITYRVYTTFPSTDLLFDNTNQNIYFKGLGLSL